MFSLIFQSNNILGCGIAIIIITTTIIIIATTIIIVIIIIIKMIIMIIIMNHDPYIHKVALHLVANNTLQDLKFLYF